MQSPPPRWQIVSAFAIVYVVWGSTYLAIRIGVMELPPALFAGARFLVAGLLLLAYARMRGLPFPDNYSDAARIVATGIVLLVFSNGLLVWGEQWVASNQAALIVATTALWIAAFGALGKHGEAVSTRSRLGLFIGFGGTVLLLLPQGGIAWNYLWAQAGILAGSMFWAAGSMYAKRHASSTPLLMVTALQMLTAGIVFFILGLVFNEVPRWQWDPAALWALAYLIVFGTLAYAAYVWLLHNVSPAALGTYAYVNPIVAVLLGWWWLDEALGKTEILGTLVILAGVMLVTTSQHAVKNGRKEPPLP